MKIEFVNSRYSFSLFKNLRSVKEPEANIDVNQLIEAIRYGYIRKTIEELRATRNKNKYDRIKKSQLPCVTISGTFTHRDDAGIVQHSGLMQVDIDKVEGYDFVFQKVCNDDYTYLAFRSPGGRGIKAIVKVNPSPDTHRDQFRALEEYYREKHGVEIDPQCINVSRCLLLSYDPDIYCNPKSEVFEEIYQSLVISRAKSKQESKKVSFGQKSKDDPHELIENIIASLERENVDITSSYYDWIKIGFALCSTYGEAGRNYFHRISKMYPDYSFRKADTKYTELLARNDGRTTLGSVIHLAKQAGIKVGGWKEK